MTALLGVLFERVMWGPMRARKAGLLQLLLMSIGLAFLIRYSIQYVWGTEIRILDVDRFATVEFLGLRIGRTELIVIVVGFAVLLAIGADAQVQPARQADARAGRQPRPRGDRRASTPRG